MQPASLQTSTLRTPERPTFVLSAQRTTHNSSFKLAVQLPRGDTLRPWRERESERGARGASGKRGGPLVPLSASPYEQARFAGTHQLAQQSSSLSPSQQTPLSISESLPQSAHEIQQAKRACSTPKEPIAEPGSLLFIVPP
jgi:hypothetical protein